MAFNTRQFWHKQAMGHPPPPLEDRDALQQPHNGAALARRSDRRERFRTYVEQMLILTLSSPTTSLPGLYLSFKASDPIFASGESK